MIEEERSRQYKKDFLRIKDKYGEMMAKFCREHLSQILEIQGLYHNFLKGTFIHQKA